MDSKSTGSNKKTTPRWAVVTAIVFALCTIGAAFLFQLKNTTPGFQIDVSTVVILVIIIAAMAFIGYSFFVYFQEPMYQEADQLSQDIESHLKDLREKDPAKAKHIQTMRFIIFFVGIVCIAFYFVSYIFPEAHFLSTNQLQVSKILLYMFFGLAFLWMVYMKKTARQGKDQTTVRSLMGTVLLYFLGPAIVFGIVGAVLGFVFIPAMQTRSENCSRACLESFKVCLDERDKQAAFGPPYRDCMKESEPCYDSCR